MDLTKEQLKVALLTDDMFQAMELLTSGWLPVEHAVLAGNLIQSSERMREGLEKREKIALPPEHHELNEAIEHAIQAAEIAFDSALNAAYQLLWLTEHCDCHSCRVRHQRANAGQQ